MRTSLVRGSWTLLIGERERGGGGRGRLEKERGEEGGDSRKRQCGLEEEKKEKKNVVDGEEVYSFQTSGIDAAIRSGI